MEKQTLLLSGFVPGWPPNVSVFEDHLDVRRRRAHNPESLEARARMLRPTTRENIGTIYVAALVVIAPWGEDDFRAFLAASRKATIIAVDDGVTLPRGEIDIEEAVKAWKASRNRSHREGAQLRGAAVSAARRAAVALEGVNKIRSRWPLPSKLYPTAALLAEAGVSLNTVIKHLGRRPIAQHNYQVAQKRKATVAAKKEAKGK
jgi:hypothetical protein